VNTYQTSEVCGDLGGLQCSIAFSIGHHCRGGSETRPHKTGAPIAQQDSARLRRAAIFHTFLMRA